MTNFNGGFLQKVAVKIMHTVKKKTEFDRLQIVLPEEPWEKAEPVYECEARALLPGPSRWTNFRLILLDFDVKKWF